MATKSAQEQGAEKVDVEEALDYIDKTMERLKTLYEQYFLGMQKQAPAHLHSDMERRIRDLMQVQIRNTGLRYRFATLQQKFGSYNSYWRRTLRQIENGTYIRQLSKISRRAAESGEEIPEEILAAMPKRMREQVKRDREQALAIAARKRRDGEQGDVNLDPTASGEIPIIGESPAVRNAIRKNEHVLAADDGDLDIDAFFASVSDDTNPDAKPYSLTGDPDDEPTGFGAPPKPQPPAQRPAPSAAPQRPSAPPVSLPSQSGSMPRAAAPQTLPSQTGQRATLPSQSGQRPTLPSQSQQLPRTASVAPPPPHQSGQFPRAQSQPPPPPPQRQSQPIPVQRPSQPIPTQPQQPFAQQPPQQAPAKFIRAGTVPGVPPAPARPQTGPVPVVQPPGQGYPRAPTAPSQVTRPNPIAPGASQQRPQVPVESMQGPFPRQPTPPAPARPTPRPEAAPPMRPPPGMNEADVNALYAKYVKAKQAVGEDAGPGAYSKLMKTINSQAPKIMEQYKAKGVEFSVVVKDNQVIIKAKPKT